MFECWLECERGSSDLRAIVELMQDWGLNKSGITMEMARMGGVEEVKLVVLHDDLIDGLGGYRSLILKSTNYNQAYKKLDSNSTIRSLATQET